MTMFGVTLVYWLGFLSGFGFGWAKRPKPIPKPPPQDVDEETMQAFERHREAKPAFDKHDGLKPDVLH